MEHLTTAKSLLNSKSRNKEDKEIVKLITIEGNRVTIPILDETSLDANKGVPLASVLKYIKEVFVAVNATAPHKENQKTISHLDACVALQDRRVASKHRK